MTSSWENRRLWGRGSGVRTQLQRGPMMATRATGGLAWRGAIRRLVFGLVVFLIVLAVPWCNAAEVRITGSPEKGYALDVNGKPFVIRGVGGTSEIPLLASCGGNAIRTWDAPTAVRKEGGKSLLDEAAAHGVYVTVGLWLGHERHGFRYDNPEAVAQQRRDVEQAVRQAKDHPALLFWGLGNEMEGLSGKGDDPRIWKEVNLLAERIKTLDPHHPVMTVVANVNPAKLAAIRGYAPAVDVLGVNVYAGAAEIDKSVRSCGWQKPYCVTEYGLPGPWEVAATPWGAPLEPSSRKKGSTYYAATKRILETTAAAGLPEAATYCLGGHAFLWGQKQEATATWFGMFLPTGEKTLAIDAVSRAWTGRWPANRAPILDTVDVPLAGQQLRPATRVDVRVTYRDPEGDALAYTWEVVRESDDRKAGGDTEKAPPPVPGCVAEVRESGGVTIVTPDQPGRYRLFVTVRDGQGSGCSENWPFCVVP